MKRRQFIAGLGSAAAWPMVARAQQPALPVVGFVHTGSADGFADFVRGFRLGLSETGYVESRNVAIEYRWAEGQLDRLPELVTDLARRPLKVIVATSGLPAPRAAMAVASTIPIVFMMAGDPVQAGLVTNLNRPGGNLTGVSTLATELAPKLLQLMHEVVPTATTIGVLLGPTAGIPPIDLQPAARALGLRLEFVYAGSEGDFDSAFATLKRLQVGGLIIPPNAFFLDRRARLGALTLRHAMPAIHTHRDFPEAGGLMSYGGSLTELGHPVGTYAGRILKGEKPADCRSSSPPRSC